MVQRDTIDNGSGGTRQNEIGRVNTPGLNSLIQESATKSNTIQIPEITLPKGGGALKGIDKKFEVNGEKRGQPFMMTSPRPENYENYFSVSSVCSVGSIFMVALMTARRRPKIMKIFSHGFTRMYTDFFYFLSVFIRVNPWQSLFS